MAPYTDAHRHDLRTLVEGSRAGSDRRPSAVMAAPWEPTGAALRAAWAWGRRERSGASEPKDLRELSWITAGASKNNRTKACTAHKHQPRISSAQLVDERIGGRCGPCRSCPSAPDWRAPPDTCRSMPQSRHRARRWCARPQDPHPPGLLTRVTASIRIKLYLIAIAEIWDKRIPDS